MAKRHFAPCVLLLLFVSCSPTVLKRMSKEGPAQELTTGEGASSLESIWREQKLIRHGELTIQVEEIDEAAGEVAGVATRFGGLMADSEIIDIDGRRRARITLRVPASEFDAVIGALRDLGSVQRDRTSVSDVTKAYADLELRLSTKRRMESRLQALLASSSGDLAAVLEVEKELGRVVGEIEELLGEQRYYDSRIATSTIQVDLETPPTWLRPGFWKPIRESFSLSLTVVGTSVAAIVYFVSLALPWALVLTPIWWIYSRVRRRRSRKTER